MIRMMLRPRFFLPLLLLTQPLSAQDVPRARAADSVPSDRGQSLFDLANLAYAQKDYGVAEQNYARYLENFPQGSHADEALFQRAQCALQRNDQNQARESLEALMALQRGGAVTSGGAFLLGVMDYKEKLWAEAAARFKVARTGLRDPARRVEATYFLARALQNAEKPGEAATYFQSVAESGGDSPYVADALRQVANSRLAAGNDRAALSAFTSLIQKTEDPAEKAEYMVKAGLIQLDSGSPNTAVQTFTDVLALPNAPRNWRSYALASLLQMEWRKSAWENVLALAEGQQNLLNEEPRYESFLIVADARRMSKQYPEAAGAYQRAEDLAPEPDQKREAGYFRLLCMYQAGDGNLPGVARQFFDRYAKEAPEDDAPHKALRLAGDFLYREKKYGEAAEAYGRIDLSRLPASQRSGILLRQGWSEWESGRKEPAEATFTKFIENDPTHPEVAAAMTRRGISRMERKDYEPALSDMKTVASNFPRSPYAQQALHAIAVIQGQLKQWSGLITAYATLHERFPETKSTGEGFFWIGRAYTELGQPEKATPFLKAAMQANPKAYAKDAGLLILFSLYTQKAYAGLAAEIDDLAANYPDVTPPPRLCWWTGQQYFTLKEYAPASKYLGLGNTSAEKSGEAIPYGVWDMLQTSLFQQGDFEAALKATDRLLAAPESQPKEKGVLKADLLRRKALCQLGLTQYDAARQTASAGLEIIKEGELNARLMLTLGDIDLARGRALVAENKSAEAVPVIEEAVKRYAVVSQTIRHPEITPEALYKAAGSLRFLKENDRADVLLQQLNREYPDYRQQ